MLEFLIKGDMFGGGLFGAAYISFLFFLIGYAFFRANDKSIDKCFEILAPIWIISFFLKLFGFPSLIIGLVVYVVFLVVIKNTSNLSMWAWTMTCIQFTCVILISYWLGPLFGQLLFYLLIVIYFIQGEMRIRKNKKKDIEKQNKEK